MTVKVNKEVVLSGGVIGSPRLLQVSGIGPASLLTSLNISVVVDLPGVGTNYREYFFVRGWIGHSLSSQRIMLSSPHPVAVSRE
jgi:choline dehydrogenase-like flavoprotein